jgi:hypothetical protein
VAPEVLRAGIDGHVGPEGQWLLQVRGCERVVDRNDGSRSVADLGERGEIQDL